MTTERMVEGTFRKCDMHVHSSSCYSRTYDKQSFFMEVLDSDLDVLAVTDHNVIDVPLLEELHQLMKARGKTLFAGVEVNVRLRQETIDAYHLVLGKGSKGSYFHAIILLSPDQAHAMADIVENLFVPVILSGSGDTTLTEERLRKMPRREFSRHTEGKAICLEDLQKEAAAIPHFFIPHENKGSRNLSHYLPNGTKDNPLTANLDYKNSLFYYSHAMAIEGGEKSRKYISASLADELHITVASYLVSLQFVGGAPICVVAIRGGSSPRPPAAFALCYAASNLHVTISRMTGKDEIMTPVYQEAHMKIDQLPEETVVLFIKLMDKLSPSEVPTTVHGGKAKFLATAGTIDIDEDAVSLLREASAI